MINYWRLVAFISSLLFLAAFVGQTRAQEPPKPQPVEHMTEIQLRIHIGELQNQIVAKEGEISKLNYALASLQSRLQAMQDAGTFSFENWVECSRQLREVKMAAQAEVKGKK